jgi:glycosyltransferase involved in cell wall biosynthesis
VTENPLVSVIVRTKDRPKLLKKALKSIAVQTYRPIEVVLVNDGGCDLDVEGIEAVLGDVSLRYIRLEKNEGRAVAGNIGIENAKGEYIGFLDDDDEFYPKHLMTLVSFLQQSDYEVAYTDSLMVYKEYNPETFDLNEPAKKEVVFSYDFDYDRLVFENYIPFMCLLFRRDPLITSGGFGDKFDLYEDWDLLIRIAEKYAFYHIKQVTANYNQWSTDYQISQVHKDPVFLRQAYLKVLSRHIDKITPDRIHDYMSGYVHARNTLKGVSSEREHYRNIAGEKETQIAELYAGLKDKGSAIESLSNELQDSNSELERLRAELQAKNSQMDKLYAELQAKGPRFENLYNDVRTRDEQIARLYAELKEKSPRIEILSNELKEHASKLHVLSDEIKARDVQINTLATKLNEREAQIANLIEELREKGSRIEGFVSKLRDKDTQLETLTGEVREMDARLEIISRELGDRTARIQTLSTDLRDREARLEILQENMKEREKLIAAIKNTKGWKLLERYRDIRDRIFPPSSSPKIRGGTSKKLGTALKETPEGTPGPHNNSNMLSFDVINEPIPARVSVIIPTRDAGDEFDYVLRRITQQEGVGEIELVVIDSGSRDRTVDIARSYTQKVFQIPPEEFHHARTRNLGAEKATGDFLAFTVQDAVPVGNNWLYKLIRPVYEERASAVSARQIPRADADLFASWSYWTHNINYLGYHRDHTSDNLSPEDFDDLAPQAKRVNASLDSVCLGIRKKIFDSYRFNADYAEDVELGVRLLKGGHSLMFQSSNAVIHSHNRQAIYFFKRSYIDAANLRNILKIKAEYAPAGNVLGTIGYLYSRLKMCLARLDISDDLSRPSAKLLFLVDLMDDKRNNFDPAWQLLRGDRLMDNFLGKIEPNSDPEIEKKMYRKLKDNILSFSNFMERYISTEDIKEDFRDSIYKLFSITGGNYLGENTVDEIDLLGGEV